MPPKKKLPASYAETLEELRKMRAAITNTKVKLERDQARRDELIAHAAGFPESKAGIIAKAGAVTPARVSQIAPVRKSRLQSAVDTARAIENTPRAVPAARTPKNSVAAQLAAAVGTPDQPDLPGADEYAAGLARAAEPRTARELPGIGAVPVTVEHGVTTKRKWTPQQARVQITLHPDGRAFGRGRGFKLPRVRTAADILTALPPEVERVVMVGPRPWHTDRETTMTEDVREWLAAPLPEGWEHDNHYPDPQNPTARYKYGRRRVEIQHIGTWVPGTDADEPAIVWHAFRLLRDAVRLAWKSDSVELLSTPTTLGQDLWKRTIPQGTEYPVMSDELCDLIRTTSGQGRFELRTPPAVPAMLPAMHYYDCTFAYAGLTWGMPVGTPNRVTGAAFAVADNKTQEQWLRGRARWHVRATVPSDWKHVGLLPCSGLDGWEYPAEPGRTFTSWASGPEVWLARQQGWHIEVIDGITWAEGKPLNTWRDKLVEAWHAMNGWGIAAGGQYADAARLAAKMIRSIVLFTIGGFHSKGKQRKGIAHSEAEIPAYAKRAEERDGVWHWEGARGGLTDTTHPEWSAEVYGRMRARLLSGPQGTGALSLAPHEVVAFRSDAMMLTRNAGWMNNDNTPGRFRLKGVIPYPIAAPTTEGELLALRDQAEEGR